MRAADHTGRVDTKVYDGIPARIILHEMDHMMGTNFTQKVSKMKLDRAKQHKKKLDKLREKNLKRIQQNERIG
jgi:peptide deformylase